MFSKAKKSPRERLKAREIHLQVIAIMDKEHTPQHAIARDSWSGGSGFDPRGRLVLTGWVSDM